MKKIRILLAAATCIAVQGQVVAQSNSPSGNVVHYSAGSTTDGGAGASTSSTTDSGTGASTSSTPDRGTRASTSSTTDGPARDPASTGSAQGPGAAPNRSGSEKASNATDSGRGHQNDNDPKSSKPTAHNTSSHGLFEAISRAFVHTSNFIGFPIGQDKPDRSLSADVITEQSRSNQVAEPAQSSSDSSSSTSSQEK